MLTPGLSPSPLKGYDHYHTLVTGGFEPVDPAKTPALTPYIVTQAAQAASLREKFPWSATKLQVSSSKKANACFFAHFPSLRPLTSNPQNNLTPVTRMTGRVTARSPEKLDPTGSSDLAEVCRDLREDLFLSPMPQFTSEDSPQDSTIAAKTIEDVEKLEESQTPIKEIVREMELSVNIDDIRSYLHYFNQWPPDALLRFSQEERLDAKVWLTVFASQLQETESELRKDSAPGIEQDKFKSDKQLLNEIKLTLKNPKLKGYFDN